MSISGITWEVVSLIVAILICFSGGIGAMIKYLLDLNQAQLAKRFEQFEKKLEAREERIERVDSDHKRRTDEVFTELKDFKTEVAKNFVHRDDWTRVEGAQDVMLRRISQQLNQISGAINAGKQTE